MKNGYIPSAVSRFFMQNTGASHSSGTKEDYLRDTGAQNNSLRDDESMSHDMEPGQMNQSSAHKNFLNNGQSLVNREL